MGMRESYLRTYFRIFPPSRCGEFVDGMDGFWDLIGCDPLPAEIDGLLLSHGLPVLQNGTPFLIQTPEVITYSHLWAVSKQDPGDMRPRDSFFPLLCESRECYEAPRMVMEVIAQGPPMLWARPNLAFLTPLSPALPWRCLVIS